MKEPNGSASVGFSICLASARASLFALLCSSRALLEAEPGSVSPSKSLSTVLLEALELLLLLLLLDDEEEDVELALLPPPLRLLLDLLPRFGGHCSCLDLTLLGPHRKGRILEAAYMIISR